MKIISITNVSPHAITDGTTLRVKNILERAVKHPDVEAHVIAPVSRVESGAAQAWSKATGIVLHELDEPTGAEWDDRQRAAFRTQVPAALAAINNSPGSGRTLVMVHSLQPMVDLAACDGASSWVADMIDEVGPRMLRMARMLLLRGDIIGSARALNNFRHYRTQMLPRCANYSRVVVVAHDDAGRIHSVVPSVPVSIIPNGVVLPEKAQPGLESQRQKLAIFHGVFSFEPNEESALFLIERVAPSVSRYMPGWRILIAGRDPTARMVRAAARQPAIELAGNVPDMTARLSVASIGLYPVFIRTGLQNKVLEALSHSIPAITTIGVYEVFRRFDSAADRCILTARSPHQFFSALLTLANDRPILEKMGAAGREYAGHVFDWDRVAESIIRL